MNIDMIGSYLNIHVVLFQNVNKFIYLINLFFVLKIRMDQIIINEPKKWCLQIGSGFSGFKLDSRETMSLSDFKKYDTQKYLQYSTLQT